MPIIRKLERSSALDKADREALLSMRCQTRQLAAGDYIVREGARADTCCALLSGYAYRHKLAGDGGRQIVSLHLRGDLVDLHNVLFGIADHSVQTLASCDVAIIPKVTLLKLADERPAVAKALWFDTLIDGSVFREWVLNVGRRDSRTRIAHLLCEMIVRLKAEGLCAEHHFELPMTQEQLADATGLTPVHVNRVLRQLETDRLISRQQRSVTILDWDQLTRTGDFSDTYLHPEVTAARG